MFGQRFEVTGLLSTTPTAEVLKAYDRTLDKAVAIKKVNKADIPSVDLIRREFELLTYLDHPNIVKVYDYGEGDSFIYYSMDYYGGTATLDSGDFRDDTSEIVSLAYQILGALDYIHCRGIIHGDVKIGNLFKGTNGAESHFVLGDFGLTRLTEEKPETPVSGTVEYIAPELFHGVMDDPRSDLYSLGIALFKLATGRYPFAGRDDVLEVKKRHDYRYPSLGSKRGEGEPVLEELFAGLIRHKPVDRFASAYEAVTALAGIADRLGVGLPPRPALKDELATAGFFGYDEELVEISRGLNDGRETPKIFILEGPPGSGKTALIKEVGKKTQMRGGVFLYVDAAAEGDPFFGLPRAVAGIRPVARMNYAGGDARGARLFEEICVKTPDRRFTTESGEFVKLKAVIGARKPAVVALDGLNLNDRPTVAFFARMLDFLRESNVTVVLANGGVPVKTSTAFTEEVIAAVREPAAVRVLELKGFSPDTVERYLRYVLGAKNLDPRILAFVSAHARGNPGIVKAIIEGLHAGRVLVRTLTGWSVDYRRLKDFRPPVDGEGHLWEVFERLEEAQKKAVAVAACYGFEFPAGVVGDIANVGDLAKAGVIIPREGNRDYVFKSPAFRNAVIEKMDDGRLAAARQAVLSYLEENGRRDGTTLSLKGELLVRGGERGKARRAFLEAAGLAAEAADFDRAVELYGAAWDAGGAWDEGEYRLVISGLADSCSAAGDHRTALTNYGLLLGDVDAASPEGRAIRLKRAQELLAVGDGAAVEEISELLADETNEDNRFRCYALLVWGYYAAKEFEAAERCARRAEAFKDRGDRKPLKAYVQYVRGLIYYEKKDLEPAAAALTAAAVLATDAGDLRLTAIAFNLSGVVLAERGEFEDARKSLRKSVLFARECGDRYVLASALTHLGSLYYRQGYVREAQDVLEAALVECRLINDDRLAAAVLLNASANLIRAGENRKAASYLDRVHRAGAGLGALFGYERLYRGELAVAAGDYDEGFRFFAAAEEVFNECCAPVPAGTVKTLRGRAYFLRGDWEGAEKELRECYELCCRTGDRIEQAKVKSALAEVLFSRGCADDARRYAGEAVVELKRLQRLYHLGKTYLVRSRGLLRGGGPSDLKRAEKDLAEAKRLFEALGIDKFRGGISEIEGELAMRKNPETSVEKGRLTELAEGVTRLSACPDLDGLLDFALAFLAERLDADRGVIFLFDDQRNTLQIKGTARVDEATITAASTISQTILSRVAAGRQGVVSPDAGRDARFQDSASVKLHGIRALMCVPVSTGDELRGVVYFDSLTRGDVFADSDLDFALIFAQNVAYEIGQKKAGLDTGFAPAGGPRSSEFGELVGSSPGMRGLQDHIEAAARNPINVMIVGESGTGKELVARRIHHHGDNRDMPFVAVNCAAIPDTLIESELFGIEKGTATGVDKKIGRFERAREGTIFLDEVGAMDLKTQAKFLRVLQEREFERLGSREHNPIKLKARIVSATNADLREMVAAGEFREDLFYRLNVYVVNAPPLREHGEDIPELLAYFLGLYAGGKAQEKPKFSSASLEILERYDWPGNVRELENCVQYALARTAGKVIEAEVLPAHIRDAARKLTSAGPGTLHESLARLEREMVVTALRKNGWVKARTARELGISETNLRYKMDKLNISERDRYDIT